jgi:hypothetical protein
MKTSYSNYEKQLGMKILSARLKLMRMIIFDYARKDGTLKCFRCGKEILSYEDTTIDHIKDWRNVDPVLFWDLENISYSHYSCNVKGNRKGKKHVLVKSRSKTERKCKVCGTTENLQYDKLLCRDHYLEYRSKKGKSYYKSVH